MLGGIYSKVKLSLISSRFCSFVGHFLRSSKQADLDIICTQILMERRPLLEYEADWGTSLIILLSKHVTSYLLIYSHPLRFLILFLKRRPQTPPERNARKSISRAVEFSSSRFQRSLSLIVFQDIHRTSDGINRRR